MPDRPSPTSYSVRFNILQRAVIDAVKPAVQSRAATHGTPEAPPALTPVVLTSDAFDRGYFLPEISLSNAA